MCLVLLVMIINTVRSAPLQMNMFPFRNIFQASQMRQQLMDLQVQQPWRSRVPFNPTPKALMVLLPYNRITNEETNNIIIKRIDDRHNEFEGDKKETDDSDAVAIDAEAIPTIDKPQNTFLLLPNARLSIGDIISAIPFLPIEINVPDTLSWMYNGIASGISSIISIIGQSGPTQADSMKIKSNPIPISNMNMPIILVPIRDPVPF